MIFTFECAYYFFLSIHKLVDGINVILFGTLIAFFSLHNARNTDGRLGKKRVGSPFKTKYGIGQTELQNSIKTFYCLYLGDDCLHQMENITIHSVTCIDERVVTTARQSASLKSAIRLNTDFRESIQHVAVLSVLCE